jgi:hypothetical protein
MLWFRTPALGFVAGLAGVRKPSLVASPTPAARWSVSSHVDLGES